MNSVFYNSKAVRPFYRSPVRPINSSRYIVIAMWLGFTGLVIQTILNGYDEIRPVGRVLITMEGIILIGIGIQALRHKLPLRKSRIIFLAKALFVYSIFLSVWGLASHPDMIVWVENGVLPFFSVLVVFSSSDRHLEARVQSTAFYQCIFGGLLALWVFVFNPPSSRIEFYGLGTMAPAAVSVRALFSLPFTLVYWPILNVLSTLGVVFSLLMCLALTIASASRQLFIKNVLFLPALIFALTFHARSKSFPKLFIFIIIFGGSIAYMGMNIVTEIQSQQMVYRLFRVSSTEGLSYSFLINSLIASLEDEMNTTEGSMKRGSEAMDFLGQTSMLDFCVGRGFGGTWYSPYREETYMVHIGMLHLILMGGLPLLFLFSGLLLSGFKAAWTDRKLSPAIKGCIAYFLVYFVGFLSHGVPSSDPPFYFLWVCLALVTNNKSSPRRN